MSKIFKTVWSKNLSKPAEVYVPSGRLSHAVVTIKEDDNENCYLDIRRVNKNWATPKGVFLNKIEAHCVLDNMASEESFTKTFEKSEIEMQVFRDRKVKIKKRYINNTPDESSDSDAGPKKPVTLPWKGVTLSNDETEKLIKLIPKIMRKLPIIALEISEEVVDLKKNID